MCDKAGIDSHIGLAVNSVIAQDRRELTAPAEPCGAYWQIGVRRVGVDTVEEGEDAGPHNTHAVGEEERGKVAGSSQACNTVRV